MFLYRKNAKKLWTIKYFCFILVIIKIKNNLNLFQILSTTDIFPISWGGLDKGGRLDKGFYGNMLIINQFKIKNNKTVSIQLKINIFEKKRYGNRSTNCASSD